MPRSKPVYTSEFPYHISVRSHNKEWFRLPMDYVWSTLSNYLFFISRAYKVEVHSFVLMSNHFHLIARFPENNISEAMNYFLRESSRLISRDCGRINQIYGGRYFKSVIKRDVYLEHVYKYVYRNPVEAGVCTRVEDYPYSTLGIRLGKSAGVIPMVEDPHLDPVRITETLKWLNKKPHEEDREKIRKSLKHAEFRLNARLASRITHRLDTARY